MKKRKLRKKTQRKPRIKRSPIKRKPGDSDAVRALIWYHQQLDIATTETGRGRQDYLDLMNSAAARDLFFRQLFALSVALKIHLAAIDEVKDMWQSARTTAQGFCFLLAREGHI